MSQFTLILHDAKDGSPDGRETLKSQMKSRLKLPHESVEEIFSALPAIIKQKLDQKQADNYVLVFEKLGAIVELLPDLGDLALSENSDTEIIELENNKEDLLVDQSTEELLASFDQLSEPTLEAPMTPLATDTADLDLMNLGGDDIAELTATLETELGQLEDILTTATPVVKEPEPTRNTNNSLDLSSLGFDEEEEVIQSSPETSSALSPDSLVEELEATLMGITEVSPSDDSDNLEQRTASSSQKILSGENTFPEAKHKATSKSEVTENSASAASVSSTTDDETPAEHRKSSAAFRRPSLDTGTVEVEEVLSSTIVKPEDKKLSAKTVGISVFSLLALGAAGFLFFSRGANPWQDKTLNPEHIKLLLSSHSQILKEREKKTLEVSNVEKILINPPTIANWKSTSTNQGVSAEFHLEADERTGRVVSLSANIKQEPSAELNPKEIVNNIQRKAWLRRFESDLKRKKRAPKDAEPRSIVSNSYAYVEDDKGTGRASATLTVIPEFDSQNSLISGSWTLKTSGAEEYDKGLVKRLPGDIFELYLEGKFTAVKEVNEPPE